MQINSQYLNLEKNAKLIEWVLTFVVFYILYLYIHIALIPRMGYDVDEILDFNGTQVARDVYLACGRWGHVLWGKIVGGGLLPWSAGLTSGVFLCIATIIQAKLLFPEHLKHRLIYGVCVLASMQHAYLLKYSMQSEGYALSVLFATLACVFVISKNTRKVVTNVISATFFLLLAMSFYQISGAVFIVLFCCSLCVRTERIEKKQILKLIFVGGVAFLGFFAIKNAIICGNIPDNDIIKFVEKYEKFRIKYWFLESGNVYALVADALYELYAAVRDLNGYLLSLFLVFVLPVLYGAYRRNEKLKLFILCGVILLPLLLSCVFVMRARMMMFLPVLASYVIVRFVSIYGNFVKRLSFVLWGILFLCCITASHRVASIARDEQRMHDSNLIERSIQHAAALRYADEQGCRNVRILVFEDGWGDLDPDFYHAYPFKNFHLGTFKDKAKHKSVLDEMPRWPSPGCIRYNEGDIIIKANSRW